MNNNLLSALALFVSLAVLGALIFKFDQKTPAPKNNHLAQLEKMQKDYAALEAKFDRLQRESAKATPIKASAPGGEVSSGGEVISLTRKELEKLVDDQLSKKFAKLEKEAKNFENVWLDMPLKGVRGGLKDGDGNDLADNALVYINNLVKPDGSKTLAHLGLDKEQEKEVNKLLNEEHKALAEELDQWVKGENFENLAAAQLAIQKKLKELKKDHDGKYDSYFDEKKMKDFNKSHRAMFPSVYKDQNGNYKSWLTKMPRSSVVMTYTTQPSVEAK